MTTITNLTVTSGKVYQTDLMAEAKLVYIDRSNTFSAGLLSEYVSLQYIRTANDDKNEIINPFIQFDVDTAVTVYISHDDRDILPTWLLSSGFTDTGNNIKFTGPTYHSIFSKDFNAGTVILGPNNNVGEGRYSMYFVMVKEIVSTCPPITCTLLVQ